MGLRSLGGSVVEGIEDGGLKSWYYTLSRDEQQEVDFVVRELKGDFASAYQAVMTLRLHDRILALEKRSPFRIAWREAIGLGVAIAAGLGLSKSPIDPV